MKLKSFLTILLAVSTAAHSLAARNHDKVAALVREELGSWKRNSS